MYTLFLLCKEMASSDITMGSGFPEKYDLYPIPSPTDAKPGLIKYTR